MWKHQKRMRQNKNKCYKQVWCFWCWMEWISHVMQDLFILTKIYPISILFQSRNNLCSQLPNFEYHKFITCSYRYSAVKYYSLNKIYIYTGSYFTLWKYDKCYFQNGKIPGDCDNTLCSSCKPKILKKHIQKQRECNKQKMFLTLGMEFIWLVRQDFSSQIYHNSWNNFHIQRQNISYTLNRFELRLFNENINWLYFLYSLKM